jgi:arabinogalactan oligomer/maltooligosaccharide transport system permease protein
MAWSVPARAVATFSGTPGVVLKIVLLAIVNALSVWAATVLARDDHWISLGALVVATVAIDLAYLSPRRAVPLKFLVPGTFFLIAFQVIPIAYNVNVAFTNWSTGHLLGKAEAIEGIKKNSFVESDSGKAYVMTPARNGNGDLVLLLVDDATGATFVGTTDGLEPLPKEDVKLEVGAITAAEGYTIVKGQELVGLDRRLTQFAVPTGENRAIRPEGLSSALEVEPTLRYDPKTDTFTSIEDGVVFRDDDHGSFVSAKGDELEPGWKTNVGVENFDRLLSDPLVRKPFFRVFVWTFVFATLTVFFSFALGLFLAIALDKPGLHFQRFYRSILIIPYAVPAFLSILVWRGLLNDDFGVINNILHVDIPWLFNGNWAKVSILLVSMWLTFPYFFLVSMGALQSIPGELTEAARVDGGGAWQIFRRVTLPLLLVAVAPLLIASFAFNFNNFNNIYLLTGGGPASENDVAGQTDILISYTWKLAFASGKGQDYGLASAVSIVIFFIVATISAISFSRTKALENLN